MSAPRRWPPYVHHMPEVWSYERQHLLDSGCWCDPVVLHIRTEPMADVYHRPLGVGAVDVPRADSEVGS